MPPADATDSAPPTTGPPATTNEPSASPVDGLAPCSQVPMIVSDVIGSETGNPDDVFMGALQTYAAEQGDRFAGLWIDRDAGGTLVLAFTDDPEPHRAALAARRPSADDIPAVEPPPEITDDRPLGEWDVTFDVVQVEHGEAELITASEEAYAAFRETGVSSGGIGVDVQRNRVVVYAGSPVTPADVDEAEQALAQAGVPFDLVCLDAEIVDELPEPIEPGTPLDVIMLPDDTGSYPPDTPVECGGISFPLGALDALTPLENVDPDLVAVLDGWIGTEEGGSWPQDGWQLLTDDGERAEFIRIGPDGVASVSAEMGVNGWIWSGAGGGGPCDVRRVLPDGLGEVEWALDPAFPAPGADATELRVLATERACASASELGDRLLGPDVVETADAVYLAFAAIPLTGDQECPGNPPSPVTVQLADPLGDRELIDGLHVAPLSELID